ncbi:MAG TPA: hypothetical protein VG713_04445 [Pirellulales bacterium]|nr:hypothetical protein [Pirellulales bacterium]
MVTDPQPGDDRTPQRRMVLLGASNLTRAIGTVVSTARANVGEPLDLLVAMGFGRSYGMRTMFLGRELPGILDCGLWRALESRAPLPTVALITDIGNDVLYHAAPEQIVDWVNRCVDRFERIGARVVITELPVCNFAALSWLRYMFFRTVYVPMCRLSIRETIERATEVNRRVEQLAAQRGLTLVNQSAQWYGLDPIHIRRAHWSKAWRNMIAPLIDTDTSFDEALLNETLGLRLKLATPEERRLIGLARRREQPVMRFDDGSRVSIY